MPKGVPLKEYTGEFKQKVVETVLAKGLSYREAMRQFEIGGAERIKKWEYQHKQYQRMLTTKGIHQSMSRKGKCLDNAVMENVFGHLKSELLYLQNFDSIEHFKNELVAYLDYYNNRRIKAKLEGLPPAVHRLQALKAA